MHEASLMQNVLAIAEKAARGEGATAIRSIHLRIGDMAGVSADALRFAFEVLSPGTMAEGGALEIERVPLTVRCAACGAVSGQEEFAALCPACGSCEIEILTGREMEVDYIETDGDGSPGGAAPAAG